VNGLSTAASFLTRVRLRDGSSDSPGIGASVPWFPVVGAFLGLGVAGVYAAALLILPSLLAATMAIGAAIALTGAFHEDGLGDTADGLGGGVGREDVLRILKEPALGTFGVLAIVLSTLLRVGGLAVLDVWTAVAVLPVAHALSRVAALTLSGILPPATDEGLGASYAEEVTRPRLAAAAGLALGIGAATTGPWVAPAAVLAGLGAWAVGRASMRKIGGLTGDVLGAAQQVSEILIVLLAVAFVTNGWPSPAWWVGGS
jgi:adenosylcobinamide-GDP ribazoletransferase